jgi:hypothetical protein
VRTRPVLEPISDAAECPQRPNLCEIKSTRYVTCDPYHMLRMSRFTYRIVVTRTTIARYDSYRMTYSLAVRFETLDLYPDDEYPTTSGEASTSNGLGYKPSLVVTSWASDILGRSPADGASKRTAATADHDPSRRTPTAGVAGLVPFPRLPARAFPR